MKFPPELIEFAIDFSNNYKIASATTSDSEYSTYFSKKSNYFIRYFNVITDEKTGKPIQTPTRISLKTGDMEFSKKFFIKTKCVTENSVFYMVLWTWLVKQNNGDLQKTDIETLQYYLSTGRLAKDVLCVWKKVFEIANTPLNRDRFQKLETYINLNPNL